MQAWQRLLPQVWFQNNMRFESIGILLHDVPSSFVLSSFLNHALVILAGCLVRETPEYLSKSSSEASRNREGHQNSAVWKRVMKIRRMVVVAKAYMGVKRHLWCCSCISRNCRCACRCSCSRCCCFSKNSLSSRRTSCSSSNNIC